jgi:hypothetical protein
MVVIEMTQEPLLRGSDHSAPRDHAGPCIQYRKLWEGGDWLYSLKHRVDIL